MKDKKIFLGTIQIQQQGQNDTNINFATFGLKKTKETFLNFFKPNPGLYKQIKNEMPSMKAINYKDELFQLNLDSPGQHITLQNETLEGVKGIKVTEKNCYMCTVKITNLETKVTELIPLIGGTPEDLISLLKEFKSSIPNSLSMLQQSPIFQKSITELETAENGPVNNDYVHKEFNTMTDMYCETDQPKGEYQLRINLNFKRIHLN